MKHSHFFPSYTITPYYTLLKICYNLPLDLKLRKSVTMFKNKIMKTLIDKYLV